MTNEEAIKLLSQIRDVLLASNSWLPSTDNPIKESFGMAINALTQEAWKEEHPVSPLLQKPALTAQPETHEERTETHACDCIERQAVLKAINNMVKECDSVYVTSALRNLEVIVADLPSAQPEPQWIPCSNPPKHHKDVIVRGIEAIGNVTVHKVMQWDVDTWRPTDYAPSITWKEWSEI